MSKAFTKGQKVTYIQSWDNKGTVYYRDAIVFSCGAKRMVLTDEITGEEMGRNFLPVMGTIESIGLFCGATFPRLTEQEAIAICMNAGDRIVKEERTCYEQLIQQSSGKAAHCDALKKDIEALHEPRAIKHPKQAIKA